MKHVAVFCGSRSGLNPAYKEAAIELGKELARRKISLVYGGASVGLMGEVANSVLTNGGKVIGVIPHLLNDREIAHPALTELIVVDSMHERKAKMVELADGFIALPGGPGTLEEFVEVFTWAQLGIHHCPFGLLNVEQYYDPLIQLFNQMVDTGFLDAQMREFVKVDQSPYPLLEQLLSSSTPITEKVLDLDQT
ncbi:lysine decarboxylase [Bacillus coahuilensis p1.1.43]|uniref:Cytokinin riboside 5'-monophosphate phosphoribohydrolase n=1 Tax=Bacillus coahuilensis p1.1.43 TaxID=1150625 RepID=A0A147K842_9BACI|nr:TIGR00730 family Rossman fold protein [Bacillus coahuilensis]KUP06372.1 lysine decarboxylase [Bacillus coahuilensis p1.1.43]